MEKKKKVTHRNLDSLGFNRNIETLLNLFYPVVWPDAHICSAGVLSDQPGLAPEAPHTSLPITALSATSLDREQRQTTLECRLGRLKWTSAQMSTCEDTRTCEREQE